MDIKIIITEKQENGIEMLNIFDDIKKAKNHYRNKKTEVSSGRLKAELNMKIVDLIVHF